MALAERIGAPHQGITMRHTLLLLLTGLATLAGCNGEQFVIEAGGHGSGTRVKAHRGTTLVFEATFDDSAVYETQDPANQSDINKLYGFSDCGSHHQQNSARFGWRWFDGALQILAYTYADGTRSHALVGVVDFDVVGQYRIDVDGAEYVFTLDGNPQVRMPRGCAGNGGIKYRLWPYFGGDETAPHEITIHIENG